MELKAFLMGCNIVAYQKGNQRYGMCCSWAQMLDYDRIGLLLGSQSVTGKHIVVGDIIGVSALAEPQIEIARHFGRGHSDKYDKFAGYPVTWDETAILIPHSRVQMTCLVEEVLHIPKENHDYFIVCKVLRFEQDESKPFLNLHEL